MAYVEDIEILERVLDQVHKFFNQNYLDLIQLEFFKKQDRGIPLDFSLLVNKVKKYCEEIFSIFQEDTSNTLEMAMLINDTSFHHL